VFVWGFGVLLVSCVCVGGDVLCRCVCVCVTCGSFYLHQYLLYMLTLWFCYGADARIYPTRWALAHLLYLLTLVGSVNPNLTEGTY